MKLTMEQTEDEKKLAPKSYVEQVLSPELRDYEQWLKAKDLGGSLGPFERDILTSFLWWKSGR